jgi:diadenosine tetraphosphatase ApaH/serine/threonine PP2A family protein phosphatase
MPIEPPELDFPAIRSTLDQGLVVAEDTVNRVLEALMTDLSREDTLLVLQSPIVVCGNTQGQYEDLMFLFQTATGDPNGDITGHKFLFLGDYVGRGYYSLNTFLLLATYKLQFRDQVWLLRGHQESRVCAERYGLHHEIMTSYANQAIFMKAMEVFDLLPLAAVIDSDVFCVHGGLSPEISLCQQVSAIQRRQEIPIEGPFADIIWSDPCETPGLTWAGHPRWAGFLFGQAPAMQFNHANRLRLIARSHQLADTGFRWHFGGNEENEEPVDEAEGRLLSVWSAPNYSYAYANRASVLKLRFPGQKQYDLVVFDAAEVRFPHDPPEAFHIWV